jgi:hypothetical protein
MHPPRQSHRGKVKNCGSRGWVRGLHPGVGGRDTPSPFRFFRELFSSPASPLLHPITRLFHNPTSLFTISVTSIHVRV